MRKQVSFEPGGAQVVESVDMVSDPETPKDEHRYGTRSRHVPTPKMSDRKKSLFGGTGRTSAGEESDLGPMSPLKFNSSSRRAAMKAINTTSFRNILGNASPESDRSLSPDFERRFTHSERYEILSATDKENHMLDEDTQLSFPGRTTTPRVRTPAESALLDENNSNSLSLLMSSDLNLVDKKSSAMLKTPGISTSGQKKEPKASFRKLSFQGNAALTPSDKSESHPQSEVPCDRKARTSLTFGNIQPISTKSFYSSTTDNNASFKNVLKRAPSMPSLALERIPQRHSKPANRKRPSAKNRGNQIRLGGLNRGVFHKIKKPSKKPKPAAKKLSTSQILESTGSLLNMSMEKKQTSKSTPTTPQDSNMQQQINRIRKILQNSKNPIEQARPLSLSKSMTDLSRTSLFNDDDGESSSDHDKTLEENCNDHDDDSDDNDDTKSECGTRKFFKSGFNRRVKRQYKVTDKVSATVGQGGKISLNKEKHQKKRKFKSMFDEEFDFQTERLEVDDIICGFESEQLEVDDLISKLEQHSQVEPARAATSDAPEVATAFQSEVSNDEPIAVQSNVIFVDRLSPVTMTSEESEPATDGAEYVQSPMTQIRAMTSGLAITKAANVSEQLYQESSRIAQEKLFPIFYKEHQQTVAQAEATQEQSYQGLFGRKQRRRRLQQAWHPDGSNQYQIDAGQKEYGAQQCPECDLVYTVHEPEEELIHENYHSSLQVLKFGGWSNETLVAQVPEWHVSGRILVVTGTDSRHKLQKVQEILAVVDRELGYVEPCQVAAGSLVYLAVARSVVLGICVVQPLQHANRLLVLEGLEGPIDCCTTEIYPARCGISRIWVSPKFRGHSIARTLLTVVKSHFVFGYQMSYDEIAFSAPTEAGKRLAENFFGRKDFLIYM